MWLSPVLPPSSRPSFGTLRVTCPSTGTQRWHVGGSRIGSGGWLVCLERYILPWEQVIIKNESRRSESISTPSRRPINTTSAPYKHQGRVARLHRETPPHNCAADTTTGTRLSHQVHVLVRGLWGGSASHWVNIHLSNKQQNFYRTSVTRLHLMKDVI